MFIAWDIETCPLPVDTFTPVQQRRYERLLRKEGAPDAGPDEEPSRKVRSLHPVLGWICCLSAVRAVDPAQPGVPRSYVAAHPGEERALLEAFWQDVARFGNRPITWITFNGKGFDAEFLRSRTLRHDLMPTRTDLLDTYPYSFAPHCDLMNLWPRSAVCLEEACELLGVENPKRDLNGGGVCKAVEAGDLDLVRRYCEADVLATMACYARVAPLLAPGRRSQPRMVAAMR